MKLVLRIAVSLLVAALLIGFLAHWGGLQWADVASALSRLTPAAYLAALACHLLLYCIRALRFQVLLSAADRPSYSQQLAVGMAQTMASIIMPAKLGELTYVVYSGRVFGLRAETSLAVLALSRVFDLAALALAMGIACIAIAATPSMPDWLLPLGCVATVGGLVGFWLTQHARIFTQLLQTIARCFGGTRSRWGSSLLAKLSVMGSALDGVREQRVFWPCALLSIAAWLCIFSFCGILGWSLGLPESIGVLQAIFGSALAILTSLIPMSAFASIGTLEAGWILGFSLFGVDKDLALATGTGLHIIQLVNVVIIGLIGHLGMAITKR